jgi:uncharacterized membrane protein YgcG
VTRRAQIATRTKLQKEGSRKNPPKAFSRKSTKAILAPRRSRKAPKGAFLLREDRRQIGPRPDGFCRPSRHRSNGPRRQPGKRSTLPDASARCLRCERPKGRHLRAQPKRRVLVGDQDERVAADAVCPAEDAEDEVEEPARVAAGERWTGSGRPSARGRRRSGSRTWRARGSSRTTSGGSSAGTGSSGAAPGTADRPSRRRCSSRAGLRPSCLHGRRRSRRRSGSGSRRRA